MTQIENSLEFQSNMAMGRMPGHTPTYVNDSATYASSDTLATQPCLRSVPPSQEG